MSNFDQILEKGKSAAKVSLTTDEKWRHNIAVIIYYAQELNKMYDNKSLPHMSLKAMNCSKCSSAGFVLVVEKIDDPDVTIIFNHGDWRSVESGIYCCPDCKTDND